MRGYSSSPESSGAWWIATDGAGLFKTTDSGATWVARNTGITHLRVRNVWVDTSVLSGSSTTNYKVIASTHGAGVFLSTDNGANFTAINGSSTNSLGCTYVRSVRVLAGNTTTNTPARLLASTDCGKSGGIYYSDDVGANWRQASGLPSDNLTVFGTSFISPVTSAGATPSGFTPYLLANTSQGIFKSVDNGLTWAALPSSPTGPNGPVVYSTSWSYVETATPAMRLIATVEGAGVFRSDDGGNTWVGSNSGLPSGVIVPTSGVSNDGSSTQTYYIALDGQGTYRSTDRGATWTVFIPESKLSGVRQIAHRYSAASTTATDAQKKILWASTYAGAYVSTDGGTTWNARGTGLPLGWTINSAFDVSNGKTYVAAADGVYQANGIDRLASATWTKIPGLPRVSHVTLRYGTTGPELWAATENYGVAKLVTDSASSRWVPMNQGLPSAMVSKSSNLRIDPTNPTGWYLALVGQGVYYFDGNTWTPRNNGLAGDALKVRSLTTSVNSVLASTDAGLFVSTNNGQSWSQIGPKDSAGNWIRPTRTAVDPSNPANVWLSVYNTTSTGAAVAGNGLWKSTDAGATWTEATQFRGSRMLDVRFVRNSSVTVLTASSWDDAPATGGVWGSQDNGQTWTKAGSSLTSTLVNAVNLPYTDGQAIATSRGGAFVWESPLGLNESRQFLTAQVNGALRYFYYYNLTDYTGKVTGLSLSAGGAAVAGTSFTQTDGGKNWYARIDLGTTAPAQSTNYTATISRSDGNPITDTVQGSQVNWMTSAATGILPNSNSKVAAGSTYRFEWTAPAITDAGSLAYSVQVVSAANQSTLWSANAPMGQTSFEPGPTTALQAGSNYGIVVSAIRYDVFNNVSVISQASGSFCYGCSTGSTQTQTLTISAPSVAMLGSPLSVGATSSAGLAVTLSSNSPDICQVGTATGTTYAVTLSKSGTCQLVASQAGSSTVQPARVTQSIAVIASSPVPVTNPGQVWQQVPGSATPGYGGLLRSMAYSSADQKLWIATDGGGLYVSEDGGANWSPRNKGIANTRLWSMTISNPSTANTPYEVWVASAGGGVYYSNDAGANFTARNSGLACTFVRGVRLIGTRLFAVTDCDTNSGVYYSDNGGTSWTRASGAIPTSATVNSITLVNPSGATAYFLAATSVGVFKSTDATGSSFAALPTTPGVAASSGSVARQTVYNVVWGTANSTVTLLAAVEGLGVYRSTDGGSTWQASNVGLPTSAALVPLSGMSSVNGVFYIALDRFGLFKSVDQGLTWSSMASDSVLPSPRFVASFNGALYAGTQAGPYASFDGGLNWIKGGAGLPGGLTSNVVFPSDGTTYAAAADGAYRLNSDGQTWSKIPGLPSMRMSHLLAAGADVYASTDSFGVYKLVNGNQWAPMNKGLPADLLFNSPAIRQDTDNLSALWAGLYGGGVYYYDPTVQTWQARSTGLSGDAMKVRSLALRGSTILAATDAGVYISQDKGMTWALSGPKTAGGASLRADRIAIDRRDPNSYFAAVSNNDALGASKEGNGLWVSRDRGTSWSLIPALSGYKVFDVRSLFTGDGYVLTAASWDTDSTKAGLWVSEDNGVTWMQTSAGVSGWWVNGVFVDTRDGNGGQAYVATRGTGLFTFAGNRAQTGFDVDRGFTSYSKLGSNSTQYYVGFGLDNPNSLVSSISLTDGMGGGSSSSNTYNGYIYTSLPPSSTVPSSSTTYTGVLTFASGAAPQAVTFKMGTTLWAGSAPTGIGVLPCAGGVSNCLPLIVWTPAAQAPYSTRYQVRVQQNNLSSGNEIWRGSSLPGTTSIAYTGPTLASGTTYEIQVSAQLDEISTNVYYAATSAVNYTPGSDSRATQTITFNKVAISAVGATAALSATATSNATVSFASDTPQVCWVDGNTLTLLSSGACVVKAMQAGTTGFQPAMVSQTLSVGSGSTQPPGGTQLQTVNFTAIPSLQAGKSTSLTATASSSLPVTFSADPASICTVSGSTLTAQAAGSCMVVAFQAGNATYQPASAYQAIVIAPSTTTGGTTTTVGSTTTTTALSAKVSITPGWNLLGNGFSFAIDVAKIFGDKTQFSTVWKWVASAKAWAFYAPSLSADAMASYAAGKGYQVLSTIDPGEGFWVNASASVSSEPVDLRVDQTVDPVPFRVSNFASGGSNQLPPSWSLIAVGERVTPRAFNSALDPFAAPPVAGGTASAVAPNLTTLWAWDTSQAGSPGWMFYAPSLDNNGTLESYVSSKSYRSFGTTKLGPGMGFWVNMPATAP